MINGDLSMSRQVRLCKTVTAFLVTLFFLSNMIVFSNAQSPEQTDQVWIEQDSGYSEAILRDIDFVNDTHGWVVGQSSFGSGNGIILSTIDGGKSWSTQFSDDSQWFNQITIIDTNTLWVAGMGILATSEDCGTSWNYVVFENITTLFTTICFANETHGWASTNQQLFYSVDSGVTWNISTGWSYPDTIRRIYFHNPEVMDAIGFDGIYHSENGGSSWELVFDKGGWAVTFVSRTAGWAIADNMLAETKTGTLWEEVPIPSGSLFPSFRAPYLTDIQFVDELTGWIVGSQPAVMHTVDGGQSWYSQGVDIGVSRLMSVDFLNSTHGWTSGGNGLIFHTTRGDVLVSRLWSGFSDSVFLSMVGIVSLAAVSIVCGFVWRRRKRRLISTSNKRSIELI